MWHANTVLTVPIPSVIRHFQDRGTRLVFVWIYNTMPAAARWRPLADAAETASPRPRLHMTVTMLAQRFGTLLFITWANAIGTNGYRRIGDLLRGVKRPSGFCTSASGRGLKPQPLSRIRKPVQRWQFSHKRADLA
jgi:hypothetical protein